MFEFQNLPHISEKLPLLRTRHDWEIEATKNAYYLFRQVHLSGVLHAAWSRLLRRAYTLSDLSQALAARRLLGSHYLGSQAVEIQKIVGSEGRCSDFDRDFRPLCRHAVHRWARIAALMLLNEPLPAVELIQVGETYYVRDGHHRISVARALGNRAIDASITAWCLAESTSEMPLEVRAEQFEELTINTRHF